jgi:putative two-component system response regulator
MGRDIAATHHERYDGTGYPSGLKGQNIPLCGRIVALADVYDALTSRRVYKAAFTHDVAKSMILAEVGSHFDPDLVETFVQNETRFLAILERYAELKNEAA